MKINISIKLAAAVVFAIGISYVAASRISAGSPGLFTWEYRLQDANDELIDYQLMQRGSVIASHLDRYRSEAGMRSTALGLNGKPDNLVVAWRNTSTSKQFQVNIDLLPLLPKDGVDSGTLGFEIARDELTLYTVTYSPTGGGTTGKPFDLHPAKKIIFRSGGQ